MPDQNKDSLMFWLCPHLPLSYWFIAQILFRIQPISYINALQIGHIQKIILRSFWKVIWVVIFHNDCLRTVPYCKKYISFKKITFCFGWYPNGWIFFLKERKYNEEWKLLMLLTVTYSFDWKIGIIRIIQVYSKIVSLFKGFLKIHLRFEPGPEQTTQHFIILVMVNTMLWGNNY